MGANPISATFQEKKLIMKIKIELSQSDIDSVFSRLNSLKKEGVKKSTAMAVALERLYHMAEVEFIKSYRKLEKELKLRRK